MTTSNDSGGHDAEFQTKIAALLSAIDQRLPPSPAASLLSRNSQNGCETREPLQHRILTSSSLTALSSTTSSEEKPSIIVKELMQDLHNLVSERCRLRWPTSTSWQCAPQTAISEVKAHVNEHSDRIKRSVFDRQGLTPAAVRRLSSKAAHKMSTSLLLADISQIYTDTITALMIPNDDETTNQELATAESSSEAASPTHDVMVTMDQFECLLQQESSASSPQSPTTDVVASKRSSGKRRRESSRLDDVEVSRRKKIRVLGQCLDDLLTEFFKRLHLNLMDDGGVMIPRHRALALCGPLVEALSFICGSGPHAAMWLHSLAGDVVSTTWNDIQSTHSVALLRSVTIGTSLISRHLSCVDVSSSMPQRPGITTATAAGESRTTSPTFSCPPPQLLSEVSNHSMSCTTPTTGFTAEGEVFSIPPPFQRSVSDIVQRNGGSASKPPSLFQARSSGVLRDTTSPPRSPLYPHAYQDSFASPTTSTPLLSTVSPMYGGGGGSNGSGGSTAPRRLTAAAAKTPATTRRPAEIPSFMLTKKSGASIAARRSSYAVAPPSLSRDQLVHKDPWERSSGLQDSMMRISSPTQAAPELQRPPQLMLGLSTAPSTPPQRPTTAPLSDIVGPGLHSDRLLFSFDDD